MSVDKNRNSFPFRIYEPWGILKTLEHHKKCVSLGLVRIPTIWDNPSLSTRYAEKTIKKIMDLMNERKSEIKGDNHCDIVFVWDIEELTIATIHYIGSCALFERHIDISLLFRLLERIENNLKIDNSDDSEFLMDTGDAIDDEAELYRIMKRIESNAKIDKLDVSKTLMNIEDAIDDGSDVMKNITHKCDVLEQFYDEISSGIRDDGPIINYELIKRCGMTERAVEIFNAAVRHQRQFIQRWRTARKTLKLVNMRSDGGYKKSANVVICDDGIENGAAQLLLSGNSDQVPIENIYSTRGASKKSIFERIQSRFGDKCVLVYVTSKPETVPKSQKVQIATWKIEAPVSIEHLFIAQRDFLLR